MAKKRDNSKTTTSGANKALLAVTTYGRPWYFALSLAFLAEADTSGYDVHLYIDGGGDPLNVQIAEKTNAKHHIFDRIIRCKGHLGCQRVRNQIFHDFKDGDWDYLTLCDDDLVYGKSVFRDMLRSLRHLREKDKSYHFAVGYVNEFMLNGGQLKRPLFRHKGRMYSETRTHGGAMFIGTREGWLAIRPEPWTIKPDEAGFMKRLNSSMRRANLKTGVCLRPFPHVQHVCNTHTSIRGWHSKWRNAVAIGLDSQPVRVPKFCLNCFTRSDEQLGGDPEDLSTFVRAHTKRLGNKIWLPNHNYEGYKKTRTKHDVRLPDPPAQRLEVLPDGRPPGVLISIPTRQGKLHYELVNRLLQWTNINDVKNGGKYRVGVTFHPGIRWPDMVRTKQLVNFLDDPNDWEWLLTVDDDIVPPANIFDMIDHGKDIVQAPAVVLVNGMFEWVGKQYHKERGCYDMEFDRFFHALKGHDIAPTTLVQNMSDGTKIDHKVLIPIPQPYNEGLFPVDTVGTGCLLVRRCVIETIGVACHRTKFDSLVNMLNTHDGVFSEWCKDAGFEMFCDTAKRCRHWHGDMEMTELYDALVRGLYDRAQGMVRGGGRIARLPEPVVQRPQGLVRTA